ncbi:ImmA/IrrE family metallo-endopeptidase [Pseudarthrobacter sp. AL07]|uniref:ImmA/IrrE family metallo-endopeptidase n=1 Tax=unclassified Pseudarthrobacter TaxID=2647000 RepID=UPI00249B3D55|nr:MULTISPECIES: ImmA/IrrE family metallo-endopeptidase [unclassified Pseudarthrobacter]MDI3194261.1 ImmA/IrrE family metallo-endopeptidase [Pseudarthrobacter sp. AL20]MDI3208328.1 ImmA/IrrE family metallo-endopeptidase [Pseudarthrobacter sp. AL07]
MQTESLATIRKRATQAAAQVLNEHWADEFGEIDLPVDATVIAERIGARVFAADLSGHDELSGFVYIPPGKERPEITINSSEHIHRRRFTCAHEIGHILDPRIDKNTEHGFMDHRDSLSSAGTDPREVFANAFAATLLMPSDEIEWLAEELDLYGLAKKFRVSTDAMSNRLATLGIRCRG